MTGKAQEYTSCAFSFSATRSSHIKLKTPGPCDPGGSNKS